MRGPDFLEALLHHAESQLWFVAITAQVAEKQMAQVAGHDFGGAIGSSLVGEMAVSAEDALLQTPRAMDAILQHFHVVIGFE